MSELDIFSKLPKRPEDAHKGSFGKVLIMAGSNNFPGAAYLASAAALRVGAGLVTLATTPFVKLVIAKKLPEVTFLSYKEIFEKLSKYNVILVGPGLGQKTYVKKIVKQLIYKRLPQCVVDADGLNVLSEIDCWWDKYKLNAILTPHPGEMARLTNLTVEEIQKNRERVAQEYSKKWKQTVVLKGADTVIASPAGEVKKSPFANPALATAGTGDVLAGIIAGLVAQGLNSFNASCVGVYLHGLAGEHAKDKIGNAGVIASDLLPILPQIIKELI